MITELPGLSKLHEYTRIGRLAALVVALTSAGPAAANNGDVMVGGVTPDGGVNVTGDSGANDYTVTQNNNGTVTVTGNGKTTVNGKKSHTTKKPVTGKVKVDGKGGDDKIKVKDVNQVKEIYVKDEIGSNDIEITGAKTSGKLKVKNENGKIKVKDSSWGKRDIRPGKGTIDPAWMKGKGGAGSTDKPPSNVGGYQKLGGQHRGNPTNNPGQRGVVLPDHGTRSYPGTRGGGTRSMPKTGPTLP